MQADLLLTAHPARLAHQARPVPLAAAAHRVHQVAAALADQVAQADLADQEVQVAPAAEVPAELAAQEVQAVLADQEARVALAAEVPVEPADREVQAELADREVKLAWSAHRYVTVPVHRRIDRHDIKLTKENVRTIIEKFGIWYVSAHLRDIGDNKRLAVMAAKAGTGEKAPESHHTIVFDHHQGCNEVGETIALIQGILKKGFLRNAINKKS